MNTPRPGPTFADVHFVKRRAQPRRAGASLFLRVFHSLLILVLLSGVQISQAEEALSKAGHRVRFEPQAASAGARVAAMADRIQGEVAKKLGFGSEPFSADIYVARDFEEAQKAARANIPDWAAGVCIGARNLIVLRLDRIEAPGQARTLETVLRHEWVHLTWFRYAGRRARELPRWAEEGIAEVVGGGVSVDGGAKLDIAAAFNRLIPFEEIRGIFPLESERAALAYRQGRSWVNYVLGEAGWDALRAVLRELGTGVPGRNHFESLLFEHTERSASQWEAEWRQSLEEQATPWFHLLGRDLFTTIVLLMAVFSVFAFFVIRYTRRKQMEALPDDGFF